MKQAEGCNLMSSVKFSKGKCNISKTRNPNKYKGVYLLVDAPCGFTRCLLILPRQKVSSLSRFGVNNNKLICIPHRKLSHLYY